jgi:hypothetical protein
MSKPQDELSPQLERYLKLCERTHKHMVADGTWPWADSPDFDDVIESEDNPNPL